MTVTHANQATESLSPATSNPSDLPQRSADTIFLAICVGIAGMLAVAAWALPQIFVWMFAIVYLGGIVYFVGFAAVHYLVKLRGGADGLTFRLHLEIFRQNLGSTWFFYAGASNAVAVFTWPLQVVRLAYLSRIARVQIKPDLLLSFGGPLVPVWLDPTMLPFLGMLLLEFGARHQRTLLIGPVETCLIAATLITLLLFSLPTRSAAAEKPGAMDSFLSSVGNPKANFVVLLLSTLGSASLAHLIVKRWEGDDDWDLLSSGWSIVRGADLRSITGLLNRTIADAADPTLWRQDVTTLSRISAGDWVAALLGLLFYVAFVRRAFGAMTAQREARHQVRIGMAYAALGRNDEAIVELGAAENYQSSVVNRTQLIACGVRLRQGDYGKLSKGARKLCAMIHQPYSREEEAVLAAFGTSELLPLDGRTLAAYFRSAGDFADGDFPFLLSMLLYSKAINKEEFENNLLNDDILNQQPLCALVNRSGDIVPDLIDFEPETLSARLLVQTFLISMLDSSRGYPSYDAIVARIEDHIASLDVNRDFPVHWSLVVGSIVLESVRIGLHAQTGTSRPRLETLLTEITARLQASELFGESVRNLAPFTVRENAATATRLRQAVVGDHQ